MQTKNYNEVSPHSSLPENGCHVKVKTNRQTTISINSGKDVSDVGENAN